MTAYRRSSSPNAPQLANYQFYSNYVIDLKNVTGYYRSFVSDRDIDTPTADNAWPLIEDDAEVAHAMDVMSLISAAEDFVIVGKYPEINDIVYKALRYNSDFLHSRKQLIYNAYLKGLGIQKKQWRTVTWRDYPGMTWKVISRTEEVSRGQLRIERDAETHDSYWTIWSEHYDAYLKMIDRAVNPLYEGPQVQDFVWFFWETEPTYPMYRGGGQIVYKLVYIKNNLLNLWGTLCEKYSHPFVTALIDTARSALAAGELGTGFVSAIDRINTLIEKIQAMVSGETLVLDREADDVRFHHLNPGSLNVIAEYVEYIDKKISQYFIGAALTTKGGEGPGSYAMQEGHRSITDRKTHYLRDRAQERYRDDYIFDFLWQNRGNLFRLGLPFPEIDEIRIEFLSKSEVIKEKVLLESDSEGKRDKIAAEI